MVSGNRRAFLRGTFLSREGRSKETTRQLPLGLRPPWHQALSLSEHCTDCSHPCTTACEPAIIKLHPADHEFAGQPYLDFSIRGCTFCRACAEACPIEDGLLASTSNTPEIGKAQLNHGSCIAWNEVICQSCSNNCDVQAISTTYQRNPEVNAELCNGCGQCVSSCPVGAISIS
jgi:ferredoxin-type protein NapF